MNVILNPMEVNAVLTMVTARLLDTVELSDEAKEQIRAWRGERVPGTEELNAFADEFNEKLADHIDNTTRRRHMRGGRFTRASAAERSS